MKWVEGVRKGEKKKSYQCYVQNKQVSSITGYLMEDRKSQECVCVRIPSPVGEVHPGQLTSSSHTETNKQTSNTNSYSW